MRQFSIEIDRVVDLLGLECSPRADRRADSYRVKCPFCADTKYHLSISRSKDAYNCFLCSTGGGALDLFGRVALNTPLVRGKQEHGGNGDTLYVKLCEALGQPLNGPIQSQPKRAIYQRPNSPQRAKDENLHAAYNALLELEYFSLSAKHKENLRRRGMDDATITRNQYRSVPAESEWLDQYPEQLREYVELGIDTEAQKYMRLKKQTFRQRAAGFLAAKAIVAKGIDLTGVPGAYRLKETWLFRLEPGMLIPSRNRKGEIVGLQTRKDDGNIRYMTVSSKSLPDGVSEGISRLHFPLANARLDANAEIMVIEGPLKADVTACLLGEKNMFCVAIQGVNNTKDLPAFFREAKEAGCTEVQNCLDMDKLTNPNVAKASRALRKLARDNGLVLRLKGWDKDFATAKWLELTALCQLFGLEHSFSSPRDIFVAVGELAERLHEHGVQHSKYLTPKGVEKRYWSDSTKGIDDYLLSIKK